MYEQQPPFGAKIIVLGYLSEDIIWSEKRTIFAEGSSRKTVSSKKQITPKGKYPSIFLKLNGEIVSDILYISVATRGIWKLREITRKYIRQV